MTIHWAATLQDWECSTKAKKVADPATVEALVQFLNEFAEQELLNIDVGYRRWKETFYEIQECGFNDYSLCKQAAKQLKEHEHLWETHNDESDNVAYEFPMAIKKEGVLYYFKSIIYVKELRSEVFTTIEKMEISFHKSKHGIKVKV